MNKLLADCLYWLCVYIYVYISSFFSVWRWCSAARDNSGLPTRDSASREGPFSRKWCWCLWCTVWRWWCKYDDMLSVILSKLCYEVLTPHRVLIFTNTLLWQGFHVSLKDMMDFKWRAPPAKCTQCRKNPMKEKAHAHSRYKPYWVIPCCMNVQTR